MIDQEVVPSGCSCYLFATHQNHKLSTFSLLLRIGSFNPSLCAGQVITRIGANSTSLNRHWVRILFRPMGKLVEGDCEFPEKQDQ